MPNDPMERVKARWPEARFCPSYLDRGMVIAGEPDGYIYLGNSWQCNEPAAWIVAANHQTVVDYWKERDAE